MAEPLSVVSIAAAVVQLADTGSKLAYGIFTTLAAIKCAPKVLTSIANEVSLTGVVLRQLSSELETEDCQSICNPESLNTIRTLTRRCDFIFTAVEKKLEHNHHKLEESAILAQWAYRIKLPYQIRELNSKRQELERIKSSLTLVLQLLSFAVQVKGTKHSHHANLSKEGQYRMLIQLAQNLDVDLHALLNNTGEIGHIAEKESIREKGLLQSRLCEAQPLSVELPTQEILEHARLATNLKQMAEQNDYEISTNLRHKIGRGVLEDHYQAWKHIAREHGYHKVIALIRQHEHVADYWTSAIQDGHLRQPIKPSLLSHLSTPRSANKTVISDGYIASPPQASATALSTNTDFGGGYSLMSAEPLFLSNSKQRKSTWYTYTDCNKPKPSITKRRTEASNKSAGQRFKRGPVRQVNTITVESGVRTLRRSGNATADCHDDQTARTLNALLIHFTTLDAEQLLNFTAAARC